MSPTRNHLVPLILASTAALLALAALAASSIASADREDGGADDPRELARRAVDPDPTIAEPAIAALRALGPDGHAALMTEHAGAIAELRRTGRAIEGTDRLRHAIDVVSGQRDGHASGLYWHTDLDAARAEAARTGRPILSLRLLGRLDEELSCANSRYFRVVLDSNAAVARVLSERFVLHWSSERPAPRITIDMGDGRTIERTITGNSVHYVLDPAGRVIDAIPGLYAPSQFVRALERAESIGRACASRADDAFTECMAEQHQRALAEARAEYESRRASAFGLPVWERLRASPRAVEPDPSALVAMPLTVGKASIETPMLGLLARDAAQIGAVDADTWRAATRADAGEDAIDPRTLALVRLKTGSDGAARELLVTAAADGARNEATLHRVVHGWLASRDPAMHTLATLNTRIYAELFLTPATDPWLGLRDAQLWDAVEEMR